MSLHLVLAAHPSDFYVALMKFAAPLNLAFLLLLALFPPRTFAQGLQVDAEEFKRMAGEVADLKDANQAHQRRIRELTMQIESLRSSLREANERHTTKLADFVTREDIKKIVDSIREVDDKREADKKLILEQIKELGKTLTMPTPEPSKSKNNRKNTEPKEITHEQPAAIEGEFYEYKVQKNDAFSKIVNDWNATLKERGKRTVTYDEVKRANPKVNLNKIYEGQKILLPLPEKK
jgi:TolA-binding protein